MEFLINSISLFVQGYLILEQFIWSLPLMIQFTLGVMNELQNIAYINILSTKKLFSTASEMDLITLLSRPNTLIQYSTILSYIPLAFLCVFILCCIGFIFIVQSRSLNQVIELQIAYNTNIYIKVLFIYVNVSIAVIKQTFGYILLDICLQTIKENIYDIVQVSLNLIVILGLLILILFFTNMFSYNWALDFQRENLMINESNLTYYRIGIKFLQLSYMLYIQDDQLFRITSLLLPLISSIIQIYQIQKLKQLIYGNYYRVILAINLIEIIICLQYILNEVFPLHKFQEIWILLIILPFYYLQTQIKRDIQKNFINFQNSTIEDCNLVLFQIIYNITRQQNSFDQQLIYLIFLQKHTKQCYDIDCICKQRLVIKNFQQISHEIYFKELLSQYERQISTMSFNCTQDQIIFSYLQLLFFQKQYLIIYQYFQIIFQKSNRVNFKNQILMSINYNINKKVLKINSLHKIIVLKVAQDLMRLDIAQQLSKQKNTSMNEAQKNHIAIKEYLKQETQCIQIRTILNQVIQEKINYLEKVNSNTTKQNLEKLAYQSIQHQINGLQKLKACFKQSQDQKQQNILMFYHMEILNDMISSSNLNSSPNYNDDINFKFNNNVVLNNEFSSMLIQINNKQSIKILQCKYNQLDKLDKLEILNFSDMIPNYIQMSHMRLIDNFISGQQNKFYQQINESYIQTSNCLCTKIDLLMDLSQLNLTSIEMIVFFHKKKDNSYSIFLDNTKRIINIDDELFIDVLNIDGVFAQYFIGLDINIIFENIDQFKQDQIYTQQNFHFIDPNKINSSYFNNTQQQIKISTLWNYSQHLLCYQCDLQLSQKANQFGSNYYELIIKNPKCNNGDTYISQFKQSENVITITPIDESIIVDKPFIIDQSINDEKLYSQQFINKSELGCQNYIQSDIQQEEQLVKQQDKEEEQNVSQEIDINTVRKKKKNKQKQQTEGLSSQQSAMSAMQKSIYYRQFCLVNDVANSQKVPQIFKRLVYFRIFLILVSIVGFSLYLYQIDQFHHFREDFILLSMKNNIFYPILSFQLIRLSIVNYNVELYLKLITQQQYLELLVYPKSKLIGSYDKLKIGISNILSEPLFFTLYNDQYLNLEFLQQENKGQMNKLDLRNSLITLLNYQFDTQNAYIENGQAEYDSSYFYYSYKNLHTLFKAFTEANEIAFQNSQQKQDDSQKIILTFFFIFLFFIILIQFNITFSNLLFQNQKEKLKLLLLNQDQNYLNIEIQRLTLLQELIDKNYSQIQHYKLNFQEKDEYFGKIKSQCTQHNRSQQQFKKNTIIAQYYNPKVIVLTLTHFLVLALVFIIFTVRIYDLYSKIKQTGQLYEVFASLNINVLSIYQTREILYYRTALPFLNQTDLDQYYNIAESGLKGLEQYVNQQWIFQQDSYYFDSNYLSLLERFSYGNLCLELQIIDQSLSICNNTLGGVLQKGISSALIDIKNQIRTEFELSNFTNRQNFPILELEGISILSYALQHLIENFNEGLFTYNNQVEINYNITIVICFCISLLIGLCLLQYDQKIQLRNHKLLTKFIFSVPLASILFDDNFLRNTRSYFLNKRLI